MSRVAVVLVGGPRELRSLRLTVEEADPSRPAARHSFKFKRRVRPAYEGGPGEVDDEAEYLLLDSAGEPLVYAHRELEALVAHARARPEMSGMIGALCEGLRAQHAQAEEAQP